MREDYTQKLGARASGHGKLRSVVDDLVQESNQAVAEGWSYTKCHVLLCLEKNGYSGFSIQQIGTLDQTVFSR